MIEDLGHGVRKQLPELSVHSGAIQHACGAGALQAMRRLAGSHEVVQAVAQNVQQCLAGCVEHLQHMQLLSLPGPVALAAALKANGRRCCSDHEGICYGRACTAAGIMSHTHLRKKLLLLLIPRGICLKSFSSQSSLPPL